MIKYAKIINQETGLCEIGLGTNNEFYQSLGMEEMDVQQSDIDNAWYLADKCPMKTDEQKEQEKAERVAKLKLRRGDVFRGLVQAKGVTKAQIGAMIENMPETTQEEILVKELARIDFEDAIEFFRGNPLVDTIGLALGITPEQLDKFFETNDYTYLLSMETETDEPTEEV